MLPLYFLPLFLLLVGLTWAYTVLRVGALSGLHRAVKACYRGYGSRYRIKDCCRACALVWRSDVWVGVSYPRFLFLGRIIPPLSYFYLSYQLAIVCALCGWYRGMVYMSAGVGAVCDRYRGQSHSPLNSPTSNILTFFWRLIFHDVAGLNIEILT